MRSENNIIYIPIGGVEYPTRVLYKDLEWFFNKYNIEVQKNKHRATEENGKIRIPVSKEFYIKILWRCLAKQGYLFWKKPFRTKKHMRDNILLSEWDDIPMFVSEHVLKFENDAIDPDSKKKQD